MKTQVKPAKLSDLPFIQNRKTKYVTVKQTDDAVSELLKNKKVLTTAAINRFERNIREFNRLIDNCRSERTKLLLAIFIEEFETMNSVFSPLAYKYEQEA